VTEVTIPGTNVRVRMRHVSEYRPNPSNPVSHNLRNFSTILESVRKLGALRSGFSSGGVVLGGNLTMDAMVEAGIEWVVEVQTDGNTWAMVDRPDLTPEMQRLAAYYDQQSARLATWNADQVAVDLSENATLRDLFYDRELAAIVRDPALP
jgi:hypothetical protein